MNFYFEAAKVIDRLNAKQGSIKGLIATLPESSRKRSAALIIETLKYKPVLLEVMDAANLMKEERKLNSQNLALVLVHDLLLGGGIQAGDGPIKQAILRHKTRLHGEFQKLKIKRGVTSTTQLAQNGDERAANIPRYARINTALWTREQAVDHFTSQGFTLTASLGSSKDFVIDAHIPNLLAFTPQISLAGDLAYRDGRIILQDKASCFPAFVLCPPASDTAVVIDATSAPGNKTSHLSALMEGKGKLFAFERDQRRFGTLQKMLKMTRCSNAIPQNVDFLTIDPENEQYKLVTHILLDPSCSGSGIVNRLDHLIPSEEDGAADGDRLAKLAKFQLKMVRHAMKFPNLQRLVYSTCSIHAAENEHVVRSALESEEAKAGSFVLAPHREVIPSWQRRGLPEEMGSKEQADSLIRCSPDQDATNGFFVSCFIRQKNDALDNHLKRKHDDSGEGAEGKTQKTRKKKKQKRRLTLAS